MQATVRNGGPAVTTSLSGLVFRGFRVFPSAYRLSELNQQSVALHAVGPRFPTIVVSYFQRQ
jgi:hypothetical protein